MNFRTRYTEALAFKNPDVEEVLDAYFHRRIAALITALLRPTSVTPNQVTLTSLLVGLSGSVSLYQAFFGAFGPFEGIERPAFFVTAGLALFTSVVLDCADGQLARVRGGSSLSGRILDGLVDACVLLPAYVIVGIGIYREFGAGWFGVTVVAGLTTWARTIVYDKIKRVYLALTDASAGEDSSLESDTHIRNSYKRALAEKRLFDAVLLRIYLLYLNVQRRLASGEADGSRHASLTDAQRRRHRDEHRSTMRMATFLGLSTHMVPFYGSIVAAAVTLDALLWVQAILATVYNVGLAVVLLRSRALRSQG